MRWGFAMFPPTMSRMAVRGEYPMRFVKGAAPFAVTLVVGAAVTAILLYFKLAGVGPHHPVFFYLLPITLVAIHVRQRASDHVRDYSDPVRSVFSVRSGLQFPGYQSAGVRRPDLLFGFGADRRQMHGRIASPGKIPSPGAKSRVSGESVDRLKLRCELIEPHNVGDIAHFVFLLGVEAHEQRNGR